MVVGPLTTPRQELAAPLSQCVHIFRVSDLFKQMRGIDRLFDVGVVVGVEVKAVFITTSMSRGKPFNYY